MKNKTGLECESVSSFSNGAAVGQNALYKKIGLTYGNTPHCRQSNQVFILFYLALFICGAGLFVINLEQNTIWKSSRSLFSLYIGFSQVDILFRKNLIVYNERFFMMNGLLYSEIWGSNLTSSEATERLKISQFIQDSLSEVISNKDDLIEFLTEEVEEHNEEFVDTLTQLLRNPYIQDADDQTNRRLFGERISINTYIGISEEVQKTTNLSVISNLERFSKLNHDLFISLDMVFPKIISKSPPYNLPSDLLETYITSQIPEFIATLRNSLNTTLQSHESILASIDETATKIMPASYNTSFQIICIAFTSIYFIFILLAYSRTIYVNRYFSSILTQYQHLSRNDLLTHYRVFEMRADFLSRCRLEETMMITHYHEFKYEQFYEIQQNDYIPIKVKQNIRPNTLNRPMRVKANFTFKTSLAIRIAIIVSVMMIAIFALILRFENRSINKVNTMTRFYTTLYGKYVSVSNYYISSIMLGYYGDFIKIGDQLPSNIAQMKDNEEYIQNFVNYLNSQKQIAKESFGEQLSELIEKVLFGNICEFIENKANGEEPTEKKICMQSLHARKGLITYSSLENDFISSLKHMAFSTPNFIDQSRSQFLLFPFQYTLLNSESLLFYIVTEIVYEKILESILPMTANLINEELESIEKVQLYLNQFGVNIGLVGGFVVLLISILMMISIDMKESVETMNNISPFVIVKNKMINNKYKELHHGVL